MNTGNRQSFPAIKQQRGAVLAISLVLLLVVTIIGTTSMQTTTLQERMAGNEKDLNDAFQSAESALRDGEQLIAGSTALGTFATGTQSNAGLYMPSTGSTERWEDYTNTWASDGSGSAAGDINTSAYIIEELPVDSSTGGTLEAGVAKPAEYYRVTARSTGNTATAEVMLQSIYKR